MGKRIDELLRKNPNTKYFIAFGLGKLLKIRKFHDVSRTFHGKRQCSRSSNQLWLYYQGSTIYRSYLDNFAILTEKIQNDSQTK